MTNAYKVYHCNIILFKKYVELFTDISFNFL